jgi:uncharacterized protein (TIGR03435 family)
MDDLDDMTLLGNYAAHASEAAFTEIVSRRVGFVYSAALRQVRDPGLAQEITQAVFVILAQKAGRLSGATNLAGWLFKTTRFVALAQQRAAAARRLREQEFQMQADTPDSTSDPLWDQISPHLDEALMGLGEKDRQTVLLHYFNQWSFAEIGANLGMTEVTARKRASRALEKLKKILAPHGVVATTALIAAAISANSVHAAPMALAKSATAAAVAHGAGASFSTSALTQGALKLMAWSNAKTAIIAGAVLLLAAGATTKVVALKTHDHQMEKLWRINKDVPTAKIDQLPPLFEIVPTRFAPPWINGNSGSNGDKFVGARARLDAIAAYAYGLPASRIRFAAPEPNERFDYVATLPTGNREALQAALRTRFGFIGHLETENREVLLLRVAHANPPGLKPPIPGATDEYWKAGFFHSSDEAIEGGAPRWDGLARFFEAYLGQPVIDQTGLTQRFSMEFGWRESLGQYNPDAMRKSLLDRLGLELAPANMPIEILVMEKVR